MRALAISCLASSLLLLAFTPGAQAARCQSFSLGPASFHQIRVAHVKCSRARTLLDKTTLTAVRRGRLAWRYAGWRWTWSARSEASALLRGSRAGGKRIRAIFAVG